MKKITFLLFLCICTLGFAQEKIDLSYYLPQDISYDKSIPTPAEIIGFEVGEWHASHDKIVHYMQVLADKSDRISIENRGTTYEGRPLLLLTITNPANHTKLEQIRTEHLRLSDASQSSAANTAAMPLVVYQGFSIHGNEASGANAALLVGYYLAAAQGKEIDELLANTIILFDPAFNPDGIQRFSTWVNMHKNQNITTSGDDREYSESWPGGRTNHYWFDMNRDWLVGQLPESQARIKTFHQWKPNILTDHHEMGTNATFFFQPGIPSRTHPLTPDLNQKLTAKIGTFHAKALDKIGSLYYTEESYDDFYYGKGSTFPDVNGGIGILFEQASSRGHAQESINGVLTFPFTIRNQFTAALSTLAAGKSMRKELLDYQRNFYTDAKAEVSKDKNKAIVFGDPYDQGKTYEFAKMLKRQHIKFNKLKRSITAAGESFSPEHSFIIPEDQPNYRMIKAMFEKRTSFKDSLFYDISAWTLPLAFDLNYGYVNSTTAVGDEVTELSFPTGSVSGKSNYGYVFEWDEYYSPKATYQLLDKGLRVKVATLPFEVEGEKFDYGSIFIPIQNQNLDADAIFALLTKVARENGIKIKAANTGLTKGTSLGSNSFNLLTKPKIALVVGSGVTSGDAGEIWHVLDTRYEIPVTKIEASRLGSVDLSKYTTLIMPSSSVRTGVENIKSFVQKGGVLIGYKNAVRWMSTNKFISLKYKRSESPAATNVNFANRSNLRGAQRIGGAIFEAKFDLSHPIAYGYNNENIALFRNSTLFIEAEKSNYKRPLQYTSSPLLSGYISKENLKAIKNTLPFVTSGMGRGKVIGFTDNTNFRAFWYGTNKLMMNAIFFGKSM